MSLAATPAMVKEHLEPPSWVTLARRRSTWVFSLAETTVPQMLLTTPEKSPEYRIRKRRFFLSFGLTKVDCSVCRSCQAITVERLLPSTNTGMLYLILPGQPVAGRFCGSGR